LIKNSFIYLLVALVFFGCYQIEKPKQPITLLSEQQMINILTDLSILSAAKGINKKKLEENGILPEDYIYKKHQIDSVIFVENNIYYSYDLDLYNRIYDKVKDTLTLLKKKADKNSLKRIDKKALKKQEAKKELLVKEELKSSLYSKKDSTIKANLLKRGKTKRRTKK